MLSVTDIMTCQFCPRKLFLIKVLGLKVPEKEVMVKGLTRHKVLEKAYNSEKELIESMNAKMSKEDLIALYRTRFLDAAKKAIASQEERLSRFGITLSDELESVQDIIIDAATARAENAFRFMEEKKAVGTELWKLIVPKMISELKLSSDSQGIKGVVDRIERFPDKVVPFEIKSGSAPQEGVWPDHKLQLMAYVLLLKERYPNVTNYGFIHYLKDNEMLKVVLNPFLELELKKLIKTSDSTMTSKALPYHIKNKKRCSICDLEKQCYDQGFIAGRLEKLGLGS